MNKIPQRQVHLDFHTSEYIDKVGDQFDPDQFKSVLTDAYVDSITCFARCHHGWLYYPSKKFPDLIHPNLKRPNLLGDQIKAAHQADIQVPIYTTVQWDAQMAKRHPEWLAIDKEGNYINTQGIEEPHFYYTLCLNSDYKNFFIDNLLDIIEVIGSEQIDGFFMDILFEVDCHCIRCQNKMIEEGFDINKKEERMRFSKRTLHLFKEEVSDIIRHHVPDASIFYNSSHIGPAIKDDLDAYSHLELESLPSGGWGYDHFPVTSRYARNLGLPWLGMTGKFHTYWGDFHSLKNKEALRYETLLMLAMNADGASIGDQLHPDGQLSEAAYELIGSVYKTFYKIEPFIQNNTQLVEVGLFTVESALESNSTIHPSILGASRLLDELDYQFDIIDIDQDFNKYSVIIFPDHVKYTEKLEEKIIRYIQQGGKILSSFKSLNRINKMNKIYKFLYQGLDDYDLSFIIPNEAIGKALPKEEFVTYLQGAKIDPINCQVLLETRTPYFNRAGEKYMSHQHAPSNGKQGVPALISHKANSYFSYPIFHIYRKNAPRWVKEVFRDAMELLIPKSKKIISHNGPNTLQVYVNQSEDHKNNLLHLLHYIPMKKSEDIYTIDDVIDLYDLELTLNTFGKKVQRIKSLYTTNDIEWKQLDQHVLINLNRLSGDDILYVEY